MDVVVTGAAGFVGSSLCWQLLNDGHRVVGADCLTPYAGIERKRRNIAWLSDYPNFQLAEADLATTDVRALLEGAEVVFALAGHPGVRASWSEAFGEYARNNVVATQRVLEAAVEVGVRRVVYASSSSVYGNAPAALPVDEEAPTVPFSPYGVTKLAGENLCRLYAANFGISTVCLRYFTVFGPRQRPDMAIYRLIDAAIDGVPFALYGSGEQARDFTFVWDVVTANVAAATAELEPGTVLNIAGGVSATMLEVAGIVGDVIDRPVVLEREPAQAGDVDFAHANIERAQALLNWSPLVSLREGVRLQTEWQRREAHTDRR
jgi:UDP-glucuronate 4-epimerase